MTRKQAVEYLVKDLGLSNDEAKVMLDKINDQKKADEVIELRAKSDLDALEAKRSELEKSYTKAKTYEEWYAKNAAAIQTLQTGYAKYQATYGDLPDEGTGGGKPEDKNKGGVGLTKEDVKKMFQEEFQSVTPNIANVVMGTGKLVERHIKAGRKTEIDWAKIDELAKANGGNLDRAYEEWDRPEAEAAREAATKAEIDRQVEEKLKAERAKFNFPAVADGGIAEPSGILKRQGDNKFNKADLVKTALSGKYEPGVAVN